MSIATHDCVGALLVRNGELLLGRRAAGCDWLADAWDVFGGHIEPGETEQQALSRELQEELGIVPARMLRMDTLGGETPESWRLSLCAVTAWSGEPRNLQPQEHDELRWCALADAQQRLQAAHPEFVRVLAEAVASGR